MSVEPFYKASKYAINAIEYACNTIDEKYKIERTGLMIDYGYWELIRDSLRNDIILSGNRDLLFYDDFPI